MQRKQLPQGDGGVQGVDDNNRANNGPAGSNGGGEVQALCDTSHFEFGPSPSSPIGSGTVLTPCESQGQVGRSAPNIVALCEALAELQVRRKFCIGLANKQTNAAGALVRRMLGFGAADEGGREKLKARAAKIVAGVMNCVVPSEDDADIAFALSADLEVVRLAVAPIEKRRHEVELQMKRIVRQLPVYPWAKSVRGLGELGLAVIIAEAGDLLKYPTKRKLWRRLGLAPFNGKAYSTWRSKGGLTSEDWIEAGYAPRRRAEIHACVGEPLFRQQSIKTAPAGPYRVVYNVRRAKCEMTHPDWTKAHLHMDGLRIMTKRLVSDLWSEWRRSMSSLDATYSNIAMADATTTELVV